MLFEIREELSDVDEKFRAVLPSAFGGLFGHGSASKGVFGVLKLEGLNVLGEPCVQARYS